MKELLALWPLLAVLAMGDLDISSTIRKYHVRFHFFTSFLIFPAADIPQRCD